MAHAMPTAAFDRRVGCGTAASGNSCSSNSCSSRLQKARSCPRAAVRSAVVSQSPLLPPYAVSFPCTALLHRADSLSGHNGRRGARLPLMVSAMAPDSAASTPAAVAGSKTEWAQKFIELPAMKRGCHVITRYIQRGMPEISGFSIGIAHIFIMHTSCSLTINENASPDVPLDMEDALNRIAPAGDNYRHLDEGYDDMPAHVKASLMGSSLTVPIANGRLALGTWQGIWLNEHRDYGGPRRLVITVQGQRAA